ncbi:MAG: LTA synthase family protein [Lachnospiraceae bacterium]|nr:LTA synthase family protein [Lachnospiraceae bacterium]
MNVKKGSRIQAVFAAIAAAGLKVRAFVTDKEKVAAIRATLALITCPVITFYLFDLYTHNPFVDMRPQVQILNIIFYELTAILFAGIFGKIRTALMIQSSAFMVIGLANYYVLKFRSTPIMPWDIYSLSTAASVADNFDYTPEKDTLLVLAGFVILLFLESRVRYRGAGRGAGKRLAVRIMMIVLPTVLLHGYVKTIQDDSFVAKFQLYDKLFTPLVMNKRDGNVVAFIMELEYLNVDKPKGYAKESAGEVYQSFGTGELEAALKNAGELDRPNIIVIMDEAFSDLSVLGEFETNVDYMPFIRSLSQDEEVSSGWLNVSVLGGNTANTEFEFLTGHSMAFLPQGSVAYQQYVKSEGVSLPAYLKSLGYSTVAIHPYYADGWERDRVYPLIGFDRFLSKDDMKKARKIRKYISDEACFDRIIELYEEKEEGQPLFIFNVTMQNHSGYDETFSNFKPEIEAKDIQSKVLNQYLSLMKKTDEAFEKLVTYFEEQEEETVILFFGDHQPTTYVSNSIIRKNGIKIDSLSLKENLLKYKVPYVLWSNFDLPEDVAAYKQETSANYLAIDVLERCGLPLPEYQSFLKGIREQYPVITANQIRDAQGQFYTEEEQVKNEKKVLQYQTMQYYLIFDLEK